MSTVGKIKACRICKAVSLASVRSNSEFTSAIIQKTLRSGQPQVHLQFPNVITPWEHSSAFQMVV